MSGQKSAWGAIWCVCCCFAVSLLAMSSAVISFLGLSMGAVETIMTGMMVLSYGLLLWAHIRHWRSSKRTVANTIVLSLATGLVLFMTWWHFFHSSNM